MKNKCAKMILEGLGYKLEESLVVPRYKKVIDTKDICDYMKYPTWHSEFIVLVELVTPDYEEVRADDDVDVIIGSIMIDEACMIWDFYNAIDTIRYHYNELKNLNVFEFDEEFEEMMEKE